MLGGLMTGWEEVRGVANGLLPSDQGGGGMLGKGKRRAAACQGSLPSLIRKFFLHFALRF